jgi:hypothetical protein
MNRWRALVSAVVFVASCSIQQPTVENAAKFGCKLSPERAQELVNEACAVAAGGPITMNGARSDRTMQEQDAPMTMNLSVPITTPQGDVAAEVACEINTRKHSVVYAHVTKGPSTQAEADFLRAQGVCSE